jgi:hypothetical protein
MQNVLPSTTIPSLSVTVCQATFQLLILPFVFLVKPMIMAVMETLICVMTLIVIPIRHAIKTRGMSSASVPMIEVSFKALNVTPIAVLIGIKMSV